MTHSEPAARDPDARARATEAQMTNAERFSLLVGVMGSRTQDPVTDPRIPPGTPMSAGYVPGVARLGVPALLMSDASLGVTNPGFRPGDTATALPAALALGATFAPELARAAGAVIGREARSRGFNVLLAGGVNLARDPRNGRNFEYLSEDPLLSARLAAASIEGIQSEGVISTIKHFSLNCNETNRHWLNAVIDPAAHRESDLLAFELAIERSHPGAVMSAYNRINGDYAGANTELLQGVLKGTWGYPGWVMSDWGATRGWEYATAGLDQECGAQLDATQFGAEAFGAPLQAAFARGELSRERLSDMVCRILRSMYAVGVDAWGPAPTVDAADHAAIALEVARQGIVLLKNDGLLPLGAHDEGGAHGAHGADGAAAGTRVAVIGGYANLGVVSGIGSAAVTPPGGFAVEITLGGPGIMGTFRKLLVGGAVPVDELAARLPGAEIEFDPGMSPADAALLAGRSDVAIVFAVRIEGEGFDSSDLSLPSGQDAVIEAVAAANPNTIVVLETGNPVAMPWEPHVKAILAAWYPGQLGARAIAEVLTGAVNPSGRLPITFPIDLHQTPRPELPGAGTPYGTPTTVAYSEGADVGYRWFARQRLTPRYAFGHGLSYTRFVYRDLEVTGGDTVAATFTVTNVGAHAGADVPQLYLTHVGGEERRRLLGVERGEQEPEQSRRLTLTADPRLLARFDAQAQQWRIAAGRHGVAVARTAHDSVLEAEVTLAERLFGR
ncbi:MAG: beta-glucosidase [Solirubrobacteraceae bacterium]|nr:beta-glucosidase [Solirubrobacteraceae bacterium]